ncbi:hypothetical protein [Maribacter antarcticus]|uniref:hypothetical protein n=1 Tax=Maribacter antarcticus TaxID=505250 RepID=UPI000AEEC330|nr:hypothetical protein [Maribacter antarcticus]
MKNSSLLLFLMITCAFGYTQKTTNAGKHLGAGLAIGAVGGYAAHKVFKSRGWTWVGAAGSSLAASLAKEAYNQSRGAVWENDDIIYTAIGGIISGLVLDMILDSRRGSGKRCGCSPLAININTVDTDFTADFENGSGDIVAAIQAGYFIKDGL